MLNTLLYVENVNRLKKSGHALLSLLLKITKTVFLKTNFKGQNVMEVFMFFFQKPFNFMGSISNN